MAPTRLWPGGLHLLALQGMRVCDVSAPLSIPSDYWLAKLNNSHGESHPVHGTWGLETGSLSLSCLYQGLSADREGHASNPSSQGLHPSLGNIGSVQPP